jgi:hypothetical protein
MHKTLARNLWATGGRCYIVCEVPLSAFDDQQLVTGLPGTEFGGLWHMQNSVVNAKITIYIGSDRLYSIIPYVQFGVMPLRWIV